MWHDVIPKGFLLGLATGLTCLGVCGPVLLPLLFSTERGARPVFWTMFEFLCGRLAAYLFWGAVIGITATLIRTPFMDRVSVYAVLFSAALMLIFGMTKSFPSLDICRSVEKSRFIRRFPLLLGAAVGLNICPPFVMSFSYLLNVGKVFESVLFFFFFFLGTTLYLVPFFFSFWVTKWNWIRILGRAAALISGLYFLIYGVAAYRRL